MILVMFIAEMGFFLTFFNIFAASSCLICIRVERSSDGFNTTSEYRQRQRNMSIGLIVVTATATAVVVIVRVCRYARRTASFGQSFVQT